jgi:hypothetical protein
LLFSLRPGALSSMARLMASIETFFAALQIDPRMAVFTMGLVTVPSLLSTAILVASTVKIFAFLNLALNAEAGLAVLMMTMPPGFKPAEVSTTSMRVGSRTTTTSGS